MGQFQGNFWRRFLFDIGGGVGKPPNFGQFDHNQTQGIRSGADLTYACHACDESFDVISAGGVVLSGVAGVVLRLVAQIS